MPVAHERVHRPSASAIPLASTVCACSTRTVQPIVGLPVGAVPHPVEIGSFNSRPRRQNVHQQAGQGYGRGGEKGGVIDVKASDPSYDEKGPPGPGLPRVSGTPTASTT